MFLSCDEIRAEIDAGRLLIAPFVPDLLKPASYVLRFGNGWRSWGRGRRTLDPWMPNAAQGNLTSITRCTTVTCKPGSFILGTTLEKVCLPSDIVGMIWTLSHLARFGLSVHLNAPWISPSFGSSSPTALTLELTNHNLQSLRIEAGMPACHLVFSRITAGVSAPLILGESIYTDLEAPSRPMLYEEFSMVRQVCLKEGRRKKRRIS